MKPLLLSAALLVCAPPLHAARGPLKETALAVLASHQDSVLFLSAVVEIEMTAGESQAKKDERKLEILGTVIGKDGLIVVPLSTLDMASTMDGRTINTPKGPLRISAKSTTKEVKILMPDGSEVDAKVVAKDPDLDLAFIRPENPGDVKLNAIDATDSRSDVAARRRHRPWPARQGTQPPTGRDDRRSRLDRHANPAPSRKSTARRSACRFSTVTENSSASASATSAPRATATAARRPPTSSFPRPT